MSLRFVIYALAFFAFVAVIDGCDKKSTKPKTNSKHDKTRSVDAPIVVEESGFGILLSPRNTKEASMDTKAEEVFRRIDTNSNGMVDAAEWVDFSKETSVWDFVELLAYADKDDDEAVSLEEFLSVQTVKIDQSDEKKDDVGVTSS